MTETKNSFQQAMKATTIFGSVQVFNIIISIIRSKCIALFIGPIGMGIASLLMTTLNLVNGLANVGLDVSSVKDISIANNNSDLDKVSKTVSILRRLVWATSLLGALFMIFASPLLSEFAFKNKAYTVSIIWISIALIFKQLTSSELAVLQGLRKLKSLAKANLIGNFIGLLITVPLYYYFRIDAIVPAIIITSVLSFLSAKYYSKKVDIKPFKMSFKEAFKEGKPMVTLGFTLSISSMIALLGAYLLQVYISAVGGISEIGLYMAGFVILNSYVGVVFSAMSTDYYPRLASINDNNVEVRKAVYEQAYIALLIITPIIVVFLACTPFIIKLLYSSEFLPIIGMVKWGILGMVLKAVSFSMGYIIIAKGDSKIFIKTAIIFNAILLIGNILGYYFGGLEGLGISFLVYYGIHLVAIALIVFYYYKFYFETSFYALFLLAVSLCTLSFLVTYISDVTLKNSLFAILIVLSFCISYYKLNKKMNLKLFVISMFKRKK